MLDAKIKLGNALERLDKNKDFQLLINHLNEQITDLSFAWAITSHTWQKRELRALLNFLYILKKIREDKVSAEKQLKLLDEYELKKEIEEEENNYVANL